MTSSVTPLSNVEMARKVLEASVNAPAWTWLTTMNSAGKVTFYTWRSALAIIAGIICVVGLVTCWRMHRYNQKVSLGRI